MNVKRATITISIAALLYVVSYVPLTVLGE